MNSEGIVLSNLFLGEQQISSLLEIRLSHIAELAGMSSYRLGNICLQHSDTREDDEQSDESDDRIVAAYGAVKDEIDRLRRTIATGMPSQSRPACRAMCEGLTVRSVAEYCRMCAQGGMIEPLGYTRHEKPHIVYFGSGLCELALSCFKRELPGCTVEIMPDYESSCEAVAFGRADFCILPTVGADDGVLLPFLRMARKYSICEVISCDLRADDEHTSRICLFGRKISRIKGADIAELALPLSADDLWQVLDGIHQLGGECESVISLPRSIYGSDCQRISVHLPKGVALEPILLYLYLCVPDFTVCGIHKRVVTYSYPKNND